MGVAMRPERPTDCPTLHRYVMGNCPPLGTRNMGAWLMLITGVHGCSTLIPASDRFFMIAELG